MFFVFQILGNLFVLGGLIIISIAFTTLAYYLNKLLQGDACKHCANFSCAMNKVPDDIVQKFLDKNPTMKTAWVEDLEGAELVEIILPEDQVGDLELKWKSQEGVGIYVVNEDNSSFMTTPVNIFLGPGTEVRAPYNENEVQYFSILAVMNVSIR